MANKKMNVKFLRGIFNSSEIQIDRDLSPEEKKGIIQDEVNEIDYWDTMEIKRRKEFWGKNKDYKEDVKE